jgi:threonine dehydratase
MMAHLTAEEKKKGVITCSAGMFRFAYHADQTGNHAQGVALSGKALGVTATVVMPVSTPSIKWRNVERLGGNVVLHGNDFDEAKAECLRLATRDGLSFIPPYDNPYVVAGQGTIGMEICRQITDCDELDGIFASIGGGGLLAGVAAYVKRVAKPTVKVIGVETVDGDAMEKSLEKGKRIMLDEVGPFADGTAVRIVGEEPFRLCKELTDGIIKVNNDEICAAIKDVFEGEYSIAAGRAVADGRNTVDPRTLGSSLARWLESTHHPKRPTRQEQEIRRHHFRWKHELWSTTVRCRASRARRTSRSAHVGSSTRKARKVCTIQQSCLLY